MDTKPATSQNSMELNEVQMRDAVAVPKHYVFLAFQRRIMLTDNHVAKYFATVTQPANPETFLCHWVNEEYLKHFAWKEAVPSPWDDSPKLIMLLTQTEIARLETWCQQVQPFQGPGPGPYSPRVVYEFHAAAAARYGVTGGNLALYLGLGKLLYQPGGDRYGWPQNSLGHPQISGVTWTESGCQFWKEEPQQTRQTKTLL
ncbi:hypothetical protein BDP55DRAFT_750720 [Colletotrichum godetiae]|uniref:Uncharacterized protein n=1 Tax=Colletotrichum godetiae TaxID=1209918 RepID=A0AAJ0AEB1_9PEZI|nr:uncharacterized protein BDP55DRAFT_750720 [Colletotrichum godetiae]KAK1672300.1 hypothetical protein BDP55DRAFT_750720 [Colletotrichum godetiae]